MMAISDRESAAPCPSPFNLASYVLAKAELQPDKCALAVLGETGRDDWTYRQLKSAVLGCATGLKSAGLVSGDRLLMRIGNSIDFPICFLAAISSGIVPVPTSTQLKQREISSIADTLQPAMVVAEDGVTMPDNAGRRVIAVNELHTMRTLPPAKPETGDPNRPAYIIFTSGTGGKPRGVVHAHRAIWARRMMWKGWYGLKPDDRLLHAGAFNWTYTLGTGLLDPWAIGATALIPQAGTAPTEIPHLLKRENASIFAAAPGVFRQMLRADPPRLPQLRHALSAGEKMPEEIRASWNEKTGTKVYEAFGMSECSTFISGSPERPAPRGTIGFPQKGRRVAILSETGIASCEEPGVIGVSRDDPGLMLGYLDDQEGTENRFRDDWFLTGDHGRMDETGAVTYLGRKDDMMNAGGYRVSPLDVESAFRGFKGISDCAAVEVKINPVTSVIALFYLSDECISDADFSNHATNTLARFKQPRIYRRMHALPRGGNGKLLRRTLRETGLAGTD